MSSAVLIVAFLGCSSARTGPPSHGGSHPSDTGGGDTGKEDTATGPDTGEDSGSPADTGWWECGEDGILDGETLCWGHVEYRCDNSSVGLRRGDYLCWPAHAFCPDSTPCDDTTEAWVDLPLDPPTVYRAVAEGVLRDPAEVFVSPIDAGFEPSRSIVVRSCSEATNAFYYGEVAPGEEVVLANGTYTDCYIAFYDDGAPGAPIRFRAETPGGVILEHSSIYMEGSYLVLSGFDLTGTMLYTPISLGDSSVPCDYCAVRDVKIDNVRPEAPVNVPYVQVVGRRTEVSDSTFIGKANSSGVITVDRVDPSQPIEARIYRNYFADRSHEIAHEGETNGFEVIRVGWSMDYFYPAYAIIEGNLFERCDGELETISIKSGSNSVRFNTFRNNAGQITIRDGFGNVVEGNYILGEQKAWSGGIRASGARTLVVDNHVEDLDPRGNIWRYPITLVTGTDDHYEEYTPTFESAVLFNRVVSGAYAFALDTAMEYGELWYPPHDNLYEQNLLFTLGEPPVLGYAWEESLSANTIAGNWTDYDLGLDGFALHDDSTSTSAEGLSQVSTFEDELAGDTVAAHLADTPMEGLSDLLVLDDAALYDRVPVLSEGDVGARR